MNMEMQKTFWKTIKEKAERCREVVNDRISEALCRTQCVAEGAFLLRDSAAHVKGLYQAQGFRVQEFSFFEDGTEGILVQIENSKPKWSDELLRTLGGQRLAVNVRFIARGRDLEFTVDNGKWLDKTFSGIVSWAVFAPLVVFPIVGAVRQHRLIRDVENALTVFFSSRKDIDCIDLAF